MELHEARLLLAQAKANAAIEAKARQGQLRRARILEDKVHAIEVENTNRTLERDLAVRRRDDLQHQLDRERAQRLRDLHAAFRVAEGNVVVRQEVNDLRSKCLALQDDLEVANDRFDALEAAAKAHVAAIDAAYCPDQELQFENLNVENLRVRNALHDAHLANHSLRCDNARHRADTSRLRARIVRNAKTNSERDAFSLRAAVATSDAIIHEYVGPP